MRDSGHSLVPADLVFIIDHWLGDLECLDLESISRDTHALHVAQRLLEGEKYVTCSRVIALIEEIVNLSRLLSPTSTLQAPRGVKVLETVIVEFNKRFGDGVNVRPNSERAQAASRRATPK